MQGSDFVECLKKFPTINKHFQGVFAIDTLPKRLKHRHFCICNTDPHYLKGSHWLVFVNCEKNKYEVFDSLGIDENKQILLKTYCKFNTKELIFNETSFQEKDSDSCGPYALYFIFHRLFNFDISFYELLNDIFEHDLNLNEAAVKTFFSEIVNK
jgi:hypothetical protein